MTANHDELAALADGYVLGTLSPDEQRAFAAHVATCADCQRLTHEAAAVAEAMARGLPLQSPRPALRDRVLARAVGGEEPPSSVIGARADAAADRTPWRWLAAAAAVIAAVMSAAAWYYNDQAVRARADADAAIDRVAALEAQIAGLQAAANTASQTRSVLVARDLARVDLSGQKPAPSAAGRVFWSPTYGIVFAATNLPPLPPGRVYQLWIVADAPISAGIAAPGATGEFSVVVSAPAAPATPKAFALTIEPEGGRPAPTGEMFLLGSM
jgi:anti-sigma-K factor RskA